MEVPNGGLGDLGDLPPIDVGDAPRPVGTTSVRFLPVAVPGAGCIANSRPRRGAGEGCCEDNSGTEGALGEEEGDGRMAEGMERVEAVGQKKGAKVGWTPGERVLLWECYIRTGGVNRDNYIKKTTDLYNRRGVRTTRTDNSVWSQLRGIGNGSLSVMEREEIGKRVRLEMAEEDRLRAFGIDMFEDSGRDEEFFGFEDEDPEEGLVEGMDVREVDGGRMGEGGDEVGGQEDDRQDVDFVVDVVDEGRREADPMVVM